jgi:hypothetical protein
MNFMFSDSFTLEVDLGTTELVSIGGFIDVPKVWVYRSVLVPQYLQIVALESMFLKQA